MVRMKYGTVWFLFRLHQLDGCYGLKHAVCIVLNLDRGGSSVLESYQFEPPRVSENFYLPPIILLHFECQRVHGCPRIVASFFKKLHFRPVHQAPFGIHSCCENVIIKGV